MRPDVGRLVVDPADGPDARPVAVVEAVPRKDVLVRLPRLGEVLVPNEAVFLRAGEGVVDREVDLELYGLAGAVCLVEAGVDDAAGADELLVDGFEAGVAELVGAGFEVGDPVFDEEDAFYDFFGERLLGFQRVVVAAFERLDEDGGLSSADLDGAVGELAAGVADGEERGVGIFDAGVELELAVGVYPVQSAVELGEEAAELEMVG